VLNTLQMWAKSSDRMTYMDVKGRMGGIDKDKTLRCVCTRHIGHITRKAGLYACLHVMHVCTHHHTHTCHPQTNRSMSAFDACRQIIGESRSTSFLDRVNAFFVDYSLLPLLVQQNYLDAVKYVPPSLPSFVPVRADTPPHPTPALSHAVCLTGLAYFCAIHPPHSSILDTTRHDTTGTGRSRWWSASRPCSSRYVKDSGETGLPDPAHSPTSSLHDVPSLPNCHVM
jgi:hypothetical protein